ncbi:DNA repair protein RecN [Tundrisphaera lichenicola]|uniref:DNA repair protein RecN n=1 Tax=Tundrisphaera lichenicola TaxID=2029860 RepID=UPI003EBABE75
MLRELSVQNLALIEDARVDLRPGYCAWTGETGAGKSLLLTALGLVLGSKASAELVRAGKEEARAAAVFEVDDPRLRADLEAILGGPIEEETLILTRRISVQGRSVSHANGLPVAVSTLRELGERLIDVHGQHESRALLDPDRQRKLLDSFGEVEPRLEVYRTRREAHASLLSRRAILLRDSQNRERERALLSFERDELASADPRPGEADDLTREAHRLGNAESIRSAALDGFSLLYDSDRSAQGLLEKAARKLSPLADSVPEFADAAADLARLADEAREVAYALRRFGQGWEGDPSRLEEVESRLALYRRLSARFRCEPDDLAERRAEVERRLLAIDGDDADLQALDAPLARAWVEVRDSAELVSTSRRKACRAFAKAVQSQLKALGLGGARLEIRVVSDPLGDDPTAAPGPEAGADRVEWLFAPNPGEEARPLRKIASGGELSRVMLAVKTALAEADRVPTLVFDEIDTGVGGRLGSTLGKKLSELARHHQVICVTHLPQMASHAAHQWIIRKQTERGRTRTTITPLDDAQRVEEIAAMLRGDSAAEGTRREALAMLQEARQP